MPLKKYLDYDGLDYLIQRIPRTKIRVTFDDVFAGETATCSMGTTTYTKTVPATEPYELVFPINELGTWTIATSYLGDDYGTTVEVTAIGQTATGHVSYVTEIDGATVTPTDDITTWLKCANIEDATVTTLADVLANRSLFETLIANSNACKYMARSTTWAGSNDTLVPLMTDDTHPSGTVFYSAQESANSAGYMAFSNDARGWCSPSSGDFGTSYVGYDFGEPTTVDGFANLDKGQAYSFVYRLEGSNDDSTYDPLKTTDATTTANTWYEYKLDTPVTYRYYRFVMVSGTQSVNYGSGRKFKLFNKAICGNESAMSLIGKYDYCSNALLGNATWASAIANSDYFEEVLNVKIPTMTSATTPSGEVGTSSTLDGRFPAYQAFDGNTSTVWHSAAGVPQWISYDFTQSVIISFVKLRTHSDVVGPKVSKIQYSNDNITWTDYGDDASFVDCSTNATWYSKTYSTNIEARYFRLYVSESNYINSGSYYVTFAELQFYGRTSSEVYVPLIPNMTSNTTPSGVVSGDVGDTEDYYLAFDGSAENPYNRHYTPNGLSIIYTFDHEVSIDRFGYQSPSGSAYYQRLIGFTMNISIGNNGTFTQIATRTVTQAEARSWQNSMAYIDLPHSTGNAVKVTITSSNYDYNNVVIIGEMQFFKKQVQTNIIHSAANDTIYMMENGSQVPLCTTNSDGDGILDFTQFMDGTYTLYSSVAKDPDNLSNDYSKSIRITKTSFGCTTEAYLMPDTVKTLYWHGYESDNAEDCISANGWSGDGSYGLNAPTHGTNSIQLYSTGSSTTALSAFGSKTKVKTSKIHGIGNVTTTTGNTKGLMLRNDKSLAVTPIVSFINSTSDQHIYFDVEPSGEYYFLAMARLSTTVTLKALWYE